MLVQDRYMYKELWVLGPPVPGDPGTEGDMRSTAEVLREHAEFGDIHESTSPALPPVPPAILAVRRSRSHIRPNTLEISLCPILSAKDGGVRPFFSVVVYACGCASNSV